MTWFFGLALGVLCGALFFALKFLCGSGDSDIAGLVVVFVAFLFAGLGSALFAVWALAQFLF